MALKKLHFNEEKLAMIKKFKTKENIPNQNNKNKPVFLVENKYYIMSKIGGGTFGAIYKAINYESKEKVAIKLLDVDNNNIEFIYEEEKILKEFSKIEGFTKLFSSGKIENRYYFTMSLLGYNLESLKIKCGGTFEIKTVLYLGEMFIDRIQKMHEKNFIHRDIKPENFTIGFNQDYKTIYLIDFGLAKSFGKFYFLIFFKYFNLFYYPFLLF